MSTYMLRLYYYLSIKVCWSFGVVVLHFFFNFLNNGVKFQVIDLVLSLLFVVLHFIALSWWFAVFLFILLYWNIGRDVCLSRNDNCLTLINILLLINTYMLYWLRDYGMWTFNLMRIKLFEFYRLSSILNNVFSLICGFRWSVLWCEHK